jgi:ABC-type dipeptide/oligopeptide/nickel transport system permease subunit
MRRLTGWASVAEIAEGQTRQLRGATYVEAARALGAADRRILARHVLPQLGPIVPVLGAMQVGAVLLTLGELGSLGF